MNAAEGPTAAAVRALLWRSPTQHRQTGDVYLVDANAIHALIGDIDPNEGTIPRIHEWGIRRASGAITASSRGWAEDVHSFTGLPIVRWNGTDWEDAS